MKLVTASEMRDLDRRAIQDLGIPSLVLMENAGRTTYQILRREFPDLQGEVAVVAGRGNNGGDGFVVARYLANAGLPLSVFLLGERAQVKGDARVNLDVLTQLGITVEEILTEADLNPALHQLAKAGLIVDALLGTGLNSPVEGLMARLIERLNHLRPPILAVDMPTGLSSDTGEVMGIALKAEVTVTYGWPKLGQVVPPGRDYVGRLWQVDISIPPALAEGVNLEMPEASNLRHLLPPRPFSSNKGNFGHLMVLAGSEGKTGAAAMTSEAALRAGAGLVTLGIPASLNDIMEVKLTEAMTLPLPEAPWSRSLGIMALKPIREFLGKKFTLAVGPGLGTHPETRDLVCRLVHDLPQPMVIDADGVNNLAADNSCLIEAAGSRVLTPHPGEMARLVGISVSEVQAQRIDIARETAAKFNITLVLKGAQTLVAAADGRVSLNPTGNPALASGGTGDVLTGLIGGFLAQGLSPWDAARLGVYLHGLAADYFVSRYAARGMIAGDLLTNFPSMLAEFIQGQIPLTEEEICCKRVIS